MKKFLIPLLIVVSIGLGGLLFARFLLGGNEDTWICTDGKWIKHGNPSSSMPLTGCGVANKEGDIQATDNELSKYSVVITKSPVPSSHGFSFEATVTNKSIDPYITNFAFYECNFTDKNNKNYQGNLMDEKVLDKAILPNESVKITFNDANTTIRDVKRVDTANGATWQECSYDDKGQNVCKDIQGMKMTSCKAYISSKKSQASNGWGDNPLNIVFP